MGSSPGLAFALLLGLLLPSTGCRFEQRATHTGLPVHTRQALSPPLHLDGKYGSMEGPSAETSFTLQPGPREILWITAYRTEVVGPDGESDPRLAEFMCHNNMDFDAPAHARLFGLTRPLNFGRAFTASQGVFEIEFPEGYGMPLLSDERITLNTMVLNHNVEDADFHVRHRVTIEYVKDEDAAGVLRPVYPVASSVMALVQGKDGYYGLDHEPNAMQAGASCAPGMVAPNAPEGTQYYTDKQGRWFTPHWVVPAGRELRRTLVTDVMNVPFETRLHYIGVHLHPYATSLALRDLTTGETLYTASAIGPERGVGLARVEHYSSPEGIPVHPDHEYEMVSVYDNPTGVEQDAMAVFFMYFHDPETARNLDAVRAGLAAGAQPAAEAERPAGAG